MPLKKRPRGDRIIGYPGVETTDTITASGVDAAEYCPGQMTLQGDPYFKLEARRKWKTLSELILDEDNGPLPQFFLPMNGNTVNDAAIDYSGRGNDFEVHGTPQLAVRLVNDIDDDYSESGSLTFTADAPFPAPQANDSLTLSGIWNDEDVSQISMVCWLRAPNNGTNQGIVSALDSAGTEQFAVKFTSSLVQVIVDEVGFGSASDLANDDVLDKGPKMLAITVDLDASPDPLISYYMDGVLRGTQITSSTITIDQYRVGRDVGDDELDGEIDSLAIWHGRILTAKEIKQMFLAGRTQWANWDMLQRDLMSVPRFCIAMSANQSKNSNWDDIGFDQVIFDTHGIVEPGGLTSSTPAIITINELTEGWWKFRGSVATFNQGDQVILRVTIDKNSGGYANGFDVWGSRYEDEPGGGADSALASHPIYLSDGDTLKFSLWTGADTSSTIDAAANPSRTLSWVEGEWCGSIRPEQIGSEDRSYDT